MPTILVGIFLSVIQFGGLDRFAKSAAGPDNQVCAPFIAVAMIGIASPIYMGLNQASITKNSMQHRSAISPLIIECEVDVDLMRIWKSRCTNELFDSARPTS